MVQILPDTGCCGACYYNTPGLVFQTDFYLVIWSKILPKEGTPVVGNSRSPAFHRSYDFLTKQPVATALGVDNKHVVADKSVRTTAKIKDQRKYQIMLNVHKSLGTLCSCRSGFANKSFGGTSILRDTMVAEL
ncbi:MAG: hypothetical protein ACOX1U_05290 [Saccharofermentanales bacterium]|jgi:hypothetical protein